MRIEFSSHIYDIFKYTQDFTLTEIEFLILNSLTPPYMDIMKPWSKQHFCVFWFVKPPEKTGANVTTELGNILEFSTYLVIPAQVNYYW